MKFQLLRPFDTGTPEFDIEPTARLREKREFSSDSEWTIYQAKVFYEGFGDAQQAIQILESSLQRHPEDANAMFCLAECHSRNREGLEKALVLCERGLKAKPMSDYALTIKARVQLALGRPIDAYISAMSALKINSRNIEAGVYLGVMGFAIALAEGNVSEMELSIENLRTTKTLHPESRLLDRAISENKQTLARFKSGWRP